MSALISPSNPSLPSSWTFPTYPAQSGGHPRASTRPLGWPKGKSIPHTHGPGVPSQASNSSKLVSVSASSTRSVSSSSLQRRASGAFPLVLGAGEPAGVRFAVLFRDLLALVLAAGDVPFDHLVHLRAEQRYERGVVDVEHQDDDPRQRAVRRAEGAGGA